MGNALPLHVSLSLRTPTSGIMRNRKCYISTPACQCGWSEIYLQAVRSEAEPSKYLHWCCQEERGQTCVSHPHYVQSESAYLLDFTIWNDGISIVTENCVSTTVASVTASTAAAPAYV